MGEPEYYRLDTSTYKFYLTISKSPSIDTISIGGRKGECVSISINKPESLSVQRGYHSLEKATIPILAWNAKCAGVGTIAMISITLSEAVKRYPYVTLFTFTDNSHIRCDNGKEISLLSLSIIEHTKTWYERHFNAFLSDSSMNEKYKKGIALLNDSEIKLPFDEFKKIIQSFTTPSVLESLKSYYESSPNYFAFFKAILDSQGKSGLCVLVVDWIDHFLYSFVFQFNPLTVPWAIPSESVKNIEINEIKLNRWPINQTGGRRYTRSKNSRVNINDILEMRL